MPDLPFLRRSCVAAIVLAAACTAATAQTRQQDLMADRVAACIACHGMSGGATGAAYFPRIAGKPAGYLYQQLRNFRDGRRADPMMRYMTANLDDAYLLEIAGYFAAQEPPRPASSVVPARPEVLERGRLLAMQGDPARKLPACVACHGAQLEGVLPAVPGLAGLPRDYLVSQLGAWKNGSRRATAPDCMLAVARQLSAEDVGAVSAWLSVQPLKHGAALPAAHTALPIDCGSVK